MGATINNELTAAEHRLIVSDVCLWLGPPSTGGGGGRALSSDSL